MAANFLWLARNMSETGGGLGDFIQRWQNSGAQERANAQLFLAEFCDAIGLPRPDPARPDTRLNAYVFERSVPLRGHDDQSVTGHIDLYRRDCFVLETKQGANDATDSDGRPKRVGHGKRGTLAWRTSMQRARNQAERYARSLPATEGRPPFVLVVDVGHSFEIYSEFTRTGGNYTPFPDAQRH